MDTLPKRLVWLRTTIGVSARELSSRAGLSPSMWGLLEAGKKTCSRGATFDAIARSTGAPVEWLMTGGAAAPVAEDVRAASARAASARAVPEARERVSQLPPAA